MTLIKICTFAALLLVAACVYCGITLRAPDLLLYAAGLLAALAVERLPWAELLGPLLVRLRAPAVAGDEAQA